MKKILFFLFLLLNYITFLFTTLESSIDLTIGIIGDQTGSSNLDFAYQELQKGAEILSKSSSDAIVHIGDLVESSQDNKVMKNYFEQAVSILNHTHIPWYLTPGDHDVNPLIFKQNSSDDSKKRFFQSMYSEINPVVKDRLYYGFDVKDYHCVVLDSLEHLHTDPRWGNVFFSKVSDQQYCWLENDLAQNKNKKGIIVFLHQPLWYNWNSWYKIHKLLQKYHVLAVVAGHFHYYQDDGLIDNIHYVIVGATGADIKDANANAGGKHHVTLLSIDDNKAVRFSLLLTDGAEPITFSGRYEMDRVQALDQMLGNLWNFEQENAIYIKDGILVNDCKKPNPAVLKLSMGNPLEMPLEIGIEGIFPVSNILLKSKFAQDVCPTQVEQNQCLVVPSARVFVANPSSVEIDNYSRKEPFWSGVLSLKQNTEVHELVGKIIGLYVRATFANDQQRLFTIKKKVSTTIKACSNSLNDEL